MARGTMKEIICVETGEVYPSIKAACEALGIPKTTFNYHIPFGEAIKGRHYRYGRRYYNNKEGQPTDVFN